MKKKLVDVLILGKAMEHLEKAGLRFNPAGSIRYSRHRGAIKAHAKPFEDQVKEEFEKDSDRSMESFRRAHDTVLLAINGEEVDLQLPPPIPVEWIEAIPLPGPVEHDSLMLLTDLVIGAPEPQQPA